MGHFVVPDHTWRTMREAWRYVEREIAIECGRSDGCSIGDVRTFRITRRADARTCHGSIDAGADGLRPHLRPRTRRATAERTDAPPGARRFQRQARRRADAAREPDRPSNRRRQRRRPDAAARAADQDGSWRDP